MIFFLLESLLYADQKGFLACRRVTKLVAKVSKIEVLSFLNRFLGLYLLLFNSI